MTGAVGPVVVLTDRVRAAASGHQLPATVRAAARGGADVVIFREKDLTGTDRLALGRDVVDALAGTATRLIVASDIGLAHRLGAWGVHLAQGEDPVGASVDGVLAVGRSCHDRQEVEAARAEGVTYITVSPVFATASKPGYGPTLGPAGAMELSAGGADGPAAYGLGGITADNAAACLQAGLSGVAMMGAVMGSPDPRRTVAEVVSTAGAVLGARS